MFNTKKIFGALLITSIMQVALCGIAFASDTVTATQEGITVTKKAEWTTYNGSETDEKGNPYAKINFTVDTTNAIIEKISSRDTDVVIVLDTSSSMASGNKLKEAKDETVSFSKELLEITEYNVRVGIVGFDADAYKIADIGSNITTIKEKVEPLKNGYGTNIQSGIWYAQNMLKNSTVKNKVMVMLSDGAATKMMTTTGSDIATGSTAEERALNQIGIAKNVIPGLTVMGVAYDTSHGDEESLKKMATSDADGNKLFYPADANSSSIITGLKNVLKNISKTITSYVVGNRLTDIIPVEFDIIEDSIKMNDNKLKIELSSDRKTVKWNWGENKLEKKQYTMSFVAALDKTKVKEEYFANNVKINTNGTTIDPNVDTLGSSNMYYGSNNIIKLKSPQLPLKGNSSEGEEKVADNTNKEANKQKENLVADNNQDDTPKTSDDFNLYIIGMFLISSAAVIVVYTRLKKKERF